MELLHHSGVRGMSLVVPRSRARVSPRGAVFLLFFVWTCGDAVAQARASATSLTGLWAVRIVQPATGCDWLGEVRLNEQGGVLSGQGLARPTKESRDPRRCPPLKGAVDGTVQGTTVRFGFATGRLGRAEFTGRVLRGGAQMQGDWSARAAAGQWAAGR